MLAVEAKKLFLEKSCGATIRWTGFSLGAVASAKAAEDDDE